MAYLDIKTNIMIKDTTPIQVAGSENFYIAASGLQGFTQTELEILTFITFV